MTVPARKVWRGWREAERRACRSSDKWGVALTLILAACGGRNHHAEEDVSIPLTQITEGIATDSVPFAVIVPQRNAGNQYLSPKDARLNPEPVGLDFDPSPSLPEGFGPISAWTGRAGSIDGLAFTPSYREVERLSFWRNNGLSAGSECGRRHLRRGGADRVSLGSRRQQQDDVADT